MAGARARRGLSPLIASVILIAITIVGGLLVYQYFQVSSESLIAAGETVFLRVSTVPLDAVNVLVYVEATNGYMEPITIIDMQYYDATGAAVPLNQQLNIVVEPGGKATVTAVIPSDAVAVSIVYSVGGEVLVSEPVKIG